MSKNYSRDSWQLLYMEILRTNIRKALTKVLLTSLKIKTEIKLTSKDLDPIVNNAITIRHFIFHWD